MDSLPTEFFTICDWYDEFCDCRDPGTVCCLITEEVLCARHYTKRLGEFSQALALLVCQLRLPRVYTQLLGCSLFGKLISTPASVCQKVATGLHHQHRLKVPSNPTLQMPHHTWCLRYSRLTTPMALE